MSPVNNNNNNFHVITTQAKRTRDMNMATLDQHFWTVDAFFTKGEMFLTTKKSSCLSLTFVDADNCLSNFDDLMT